jgi:hypothetical protein
MMANNSKDLESLYARDINLLDSEGRVRLRLALAADGSPSIQLNDSSGRPRLDIQLDSTENPHIVFFSAKSEALLGIGLSEEESSAGITMWSGDEEKHHLTIEVGPDGIRQTGC